MAAEPVPRRFTLAEYYRMGKAGIPKPNDRVELIEGEVIQLPPIGDRHAWCVNRLNQRFVLGLGDAAIVSVERHGMWTSTASGSGRIAIRRQRGIARCRCSSTATTLHLLLALELTVDEILG